MASLQRQYSLLETYETVLVKKKLTVSELPNGCCNNLDTQLKDTSTQIPITNHIYECYNYEYVVQLQLVDRNMYINVFIFNGHIRVSNCSMECMV